MPELDSIEAAPAKAAVPRRRNTGKSKKRTRRPAVKVTPAIAMDAAVQNTGEEPAPVKHKVTAPWRPAKRLDLPKETEERLKKEGYRPRWVNKRALGNIDKKIAEGWEFDKSVSSGRANSLNRTINDGTPLDGTTHIAELVLMKIPEEKAVSRNKYYSDRANRSFTESKQRLTSNLRTDSGDDRVKAYGSVTEEREFRRT